MMKKPMEIVVLDGHAANPGDISWEPIEAIGHLTVYPRTSPDEVIERALQADAVLTNKVVLDADKLSQLPSLRYIGVLATGYNVVDTQAARERGIIVTNIPAYSTDSVTQLTLAHILNVACRVDHYARQNREGRWAQGPDFCYWDTPLQELSGKTLGIIGLGNIGMKVAKLARALGMDVFAMTSKHHADLPAGIQKATLEGVLAVSDYLTLHCPLTNDTRHLINATTLGMMKPGATIINTGRGPLVDEEAVVKALDSGHLAAFCADVLTQEPPAADSPLLRHPHAFITPHIAWATFEARQRLMAISADNLRAFAEGQPIHVVN